MKVDLRELPGRSPRCEIGLCKNRSDISIGDASARGGLGRTLMCDDCAKQVRKLLNDRYAITEVEFIEPVYGKSPVVEEMQKRIEASFGIPADIIDAEGTSTASAMKAIDDGDLPADIDGVTTGIIQPDGEKPVEAMTVPELKKHATALGLEFKSSIKKDELLILIDLNG